MLALMHETLVWMAVLFAAMFWAGYLLALLIDKRKIPVAVLFSMFSTPLFFQ